ncbi:alpha/beta fold hydrolase [Alkalihalobacillus sp. AL-G]|uniref:alpha/beta fold hydrolase n=1 Tax=Alkalihalobacillus sp. AL-G TaxID=2926399 RepID=UPI00272A2EAC|nr:alpha/beta hydrolase [Alkalihalobacillus sp. AL-G]WLD94567.1 alpha/beta hydrolase [Alkalihalobacillus sp. AL-G]
MPFCKVNKANIYYEDKGTGKPIVMIHGFSPDHRLMSGCMEPLFDKRTGLRRIYIDLPGMGQTKDYEQINNTDEMLEVVIDFIDTLLPNESFLLAGESYGGYLTRGIIGERNEQILGAAFICPMIIPGKKDRTLPDPFIVHSDREFLSTLTKDELDQFSTNQVVLDEYNWKRYTEEVMAGCQIADEEFLVKIQKSYGLSFSLDEVGFKKPSVFLLGKQDSVAGYEDALHIIDKYPRGTFAVLDRAGHNLQIEQSTLFNSLINDWLDRVDEYTDEGDVQ